MDIYEKQYGNLCAKCKSSSCCLINNTSSINCYDIVRLAIGLNISVKEFLLKYTVDWFADYDYEKSKKALKLQTEKGHPCDLTWIAHKTPSMFGVNCCTFLNWNKEAQSMRCSIYEFRPDVCRDWHTPDCDDSNVVFAMNDSFKASLRPYFKSTRALLDYIEELKHNKDYVLYDITKYQRPIEEKLQELMKELTKQNYSYDFNYSVKVPKYKKVLPFDKFKCTDDDGYNNHYYPNLLTNASITNFGKYFSDKVETHLVKALIYVESVFVLDSYLKELDIKQQKELTTLAKPILNLIDSGVLNRKDFETKNSKITNILKSQNDDGFWLVKHKDLKKEIYETMKLSIKNTLILCGYYVNLFKSVK